MVTQGQQVEWRRHPEAETFLIKRLEPFVAEMPLLRAFAVQLYQRASGRLIDWLDHLVLADGALVRGELPSWGLRQRSRRQTQGTSCATTRGRYCHW
jgi:hypothetical protein